MKKPDLLYQIALTFLHGIGPRKARMMVSKLGNVESVFTQKVSDINHQTGLSKNLLIGMERDKALAIADEQLNFVLKYNIQTHFYLEQNYPRRLKQCDDSPLLLYSKGRLNPNPQRVIAVVGTRSSTSYGEALCEQFITSISGYDIQVISGMAYGIDVLAHQLCIKHNIQTLGVLGHGLDRIYPTTHRKIAESMVGNGGLFTEFPIGTKPDRENFPMRNRIVAGMSDAIIVIESSQKGGSLITARLANEYHRDVFAFPGNIGQKYSQGCNELIKTQKAQLVISGEDFLNEMEWKTIENHTSGTQRSCFVELTEIEQEICNLLNGKGGEFIDVIANHSNITISELNVHLFHLEMKGMVKCLPGKKYMLI